MEYQENPLKIFMNVISSAKIRLHLNNQYNSHTLHWYTEKCTHEQLHIFHGSMNVLHGEIITNLGFLVLITPLMFFLPLSTNG